MDKSWYIFQPLKSLVINEPSLVLTGRILMSAVALNTHLIPGTLELLCSKDLAFSKIKYLVLSCICIREKEK